VRILVAGFGNLLRRDDGFGVHLVKRLQGRRDLPRGVELLDAGIGGISLVQELLGGYDALIVLDALTGPPGEASSGASDGSARAASHVASLGAASSALDDNLAGRVKVLSAEVPSAAELPRDFLADTHYAEPGRALVLAKAVGALPDQVFIVGCVARSEEIGHGLTAAVEAALEPALQEVLKLVGTLNCPRNAPVMEGG
jgi:hydrogenase maturation protease